MMNSKSKILERLGSQTKSAKRPLPEWESSTFDGDLEAHFTTAIQANKGQVMELADFEIWMTKQVFQTILCLSKYFQEEKSIALPSDAHDLAHLNLTILDGQFGTAENGAIWLEDDNLQLRAIPFITEHLVVFLSRKNLVSDMHAAYAKIQESKAGFGLFLAGPSKTADIEQSLVIGAHGSKSLLVVWHD